MRAAGLPAVLGAALLLATVAGAPGRAVPAGGTPTLRAAGSATGGSWTEAQVRRYAEVYDLVVVGASARAARVQLFHQAHPGILVLAYTCGFDVHEDAPLYAWIRARHPGWFLRDAAGRPIHTYRDAKRWALDCGLDDVRAFLADSASRRVRELGADGILEDNVLPTWDCRNLAPGAARLERYATVAEWRAALERYLEALERAVAPASVGANQVVPWTRHARIVAVEQLPPGGPRWEEMLRDFAVLARDPARIPYLQQHLDGPQDPMRAFATASYLMAVEPGALLSLQWDGPRESVAALPEHRLSLGRPLGPARQEAGVWWRDFERARVLVNPTADERPAPWPSWGGGRRTAGLPARRAGIAWRPGATHEELPQWVTP
jgi:hypothetical protein